MAEKVFHIQSIDPVDFYGINNQLINYIREQFGMLNITGRGEQIKVTGPEDEIQKFTGFYQFFLKQIENEGPVDLFWLQKQLHDGGKTSYEEPENNNAGKEEKMYQLVHGRNGNLIKAKTINQKNMVDACRENDLILAIGPAGTGKTYTAVALAVQALKNKEVKRIILTRPAVEAGENLGFLPGDMKEKLDPYLRPLYDALFDMIPFNRLSKFMEDGTIEIAPLAYMRGRTLDNAFVILDEAQNASINQLKMFLTRMGKNAKFIVNGDITQVDLPKKIKSGLIHAMDVLENTSGIRLIYLDNRDVIRHPLVTKIIHAYNNNESSSNNKK